VSPYFFSRLTPGLASRKTRYKKKTPSDSSFRQAILTKLLGLGYMDLPMFLGKLIPGLQAILTKLLGGLLLNALLSNAPNQWFFL